jgi:twitching motility protein PilT
LLLSSDLPLMIRMHCDVRKINLPSLEHAQLHAMVYDIINDGQRKTFEETSDAPVTIYF